MDLDTNRSLIAAALARVAVGDRTALRMVYQDTSAKLFGVLIRILNDKSEAEDVLQDVYVTVWNKAGTSTRPGEPDHLAGRDRAQPGDRPAARGRREPAHGADRGGRGRAR